MKVLNVYVEEPIDVTQLMKDITAEQVVNVDIRELAKAEGKYEIVVCLHALQVLEANEVPNAVQNMVDLVKVNGELWITVPSLEWTLEQMASENPHPATQIVLYGPENTHYRSGFSLGWLRALVDECNGMVVRWAQQDMYHLSISGKTTQALQNRVIGLKVRDDDTAANALD